MSLRRQWKGTSLLLALGLITFSAQFLSGCGDPGDEGDALVEEQKAPLFVDFQREYEAPTENYFLTDKIQAVLPDDDDGEQVPLIIHPFVRKFHPKVLASARVEDQVIEIPWALVEGDEYRSIHREDVIISGLGGDDFWRVVTDVEETEDLLRIHTRDAEAADVIMQGDFYLEVESGYLLPEGFNLLDVYIQPEVSNYRQVRQRQTTEGCEGRSGPCTCLTLEVDEVLNSTDSEDVEWVNTQRGIYNLGVLTPHNNWLNARQLKEKLEDYPDGERDELFDRARNRCEQAHNWNGPQVHDAYLQAYATSNSETDPVPPSVVCFEEWLHDRIAAETRETVADSDNFEDGATGTTDVTIDEICELIDFSGGPGPEVEAEAEAGVDGKMGEAFVDMEYDFPGPSWGQSMAADQLCVDNCQSADNPDECAAECPIFKECAGDFCFAFEELSVSYKPKFKFKLKLRPWKGKASVKFAGPLSFRIGVLLTANYEYSWERSTEINIPTGIGFSLGPIGFYISVFAGMGVSFSFEAKGSIRAVYEMKREAGLEIGAKYWGVRPFAERIWEDPPTSEFKIETTGGIGAHFQAWAEAGVALNAGVGVASKKLVWLVPLRVVLTASAAIRPPACPYDVGMFLASEWGYDLDFKVFRFSKTGTLFPPQYLFRYSGSLEERIPPLKHICGVSIEPPVYDDTIGYCALDSECDGGICVGGTCVDTGDLRMTLRWGDRVDLNLWVVTPSGEVHSVAGGKQENFTRWDCGGTCEDSAEFEDEYIENIVFNDPEPGVYIFYVARNDKHPNLGGLDVYGYTVEVEDKEGNFESIKGQMDLSFDQMPMTYHYCVPSGPNREGCPN